MYTAYPLSCVYHTSFCRWIHVQSRRYLVMCDMDLAFDHEIDEPAALHLAVVAGHLADSVCTTNIYVQGIEKSRHVTCSSFIILNSITCILCCCIHENRKFIHLFSWLPRRRRVHLVFVYRYLQL